MRNIIKTIIRFLYRSLKYTSFMQAIDEEFEIQTYQAVTSRHYEYPFGVSEIVKLNGKKPIHKILDVGSFGSPFGLILSSLDFEVVGVDLVDWKIQFPKFTLKKADIKDLPFEDESFDAVTAISTIEHCGLPRFNENEDKVGDIKAMQDIYRVLKDGGYCILTVPYVSHGTIYSNKHRIYDKKIFTKLIGKFKIVKQNFFAPIIDPKFFQPCSEKDINKFKSVEGTYGITCVVLKK